MPSLPLDDIPCEFSGPYVLLHLVLCRNLFSRVILQVKCRKYSNSRGRLGKLSNIMLQYKRAVLLESHPILYGYIHTCRADEALNRLKSRKPPEACFDGVISLSSITSPPCDSTVHDEFVLRVRCRGKIHKYSVRSVRSGEEGVVGLCVGGLERRVKCRGNTPSGV